MQYGQAELDYSTAKFTIKVNVEGKIDRPQAVIDHMLATATTVASIGFIQYGLSDSEADGDGSRSEQSCSVPASFGDITVTAEVGIKPKRHISNRKLNTLVFGAILPKVWETASIYLGESQTMTSPKAPLSSMTPREIWDGVGFALGLEQPLIAADLTPSSGSDRRISHLVSRGRQLVSSH